MKIKYIILFLLKIKWLAGAAILLAIVFYLISFSEMSDDENFGKSMIGYLGLLAICASLILVKNKLVAMFAARSKYPGMYYTLYDKLGIGTFNTSLSDEYIMDDLYKPQHTTTQFLKDNGLRPEIYISGVSESVLKVIYLSGVLPLVFYYFKRDDLSMYILMAYFVLIVVVSILNDVLKWRVPSGRQPDINFTDSSLFLYDKHIRWNNISDWLYVYKSQIEQERIIISLKEPVGGNTQYNIMLEYLNASAVEILMLLAHYKFRYDRYSPN